MQYVTTLFAQAYGACNYGASSYQNSTCQTTAGGTATGGSSGSAAGGILTNTGFDIALIVTVACVIALVAVLVRFWKRPRKKLATEQ